MGIYQKIQELCKKKKTSVAEMERTLGFSRGSIAKIDQHKPSADKIQKISDYLGVPTTYFYSEQTFPKEFTKIYEASAGHGRINDDNGTSDEYSTVRIVGDSMMPSLHDGDLVRVHHVTDDISSKDFAVVKIDGNEAVIKHIEIQSDGLLVRSENKDYEDVFYSMQECLTIPVTIIGKATEIIQRKL